MKILLVMASPGPLVGGMEKQVAWQANELAKRVDVKLCVLASEAYAPLFDKSIQFEGCNMKRGRRSLILLWQLAQKIRHFSPDIVHAHGHKATQLMASLKPYVSCRLVATMHGLKKNNQAMAHMNAVIAVSPGIQGSLKTRKAELIYNGVPPCSSKAGSRIDHSALCAMFTLNPELPIVIALGRLAKVKRYDVLIKAMRDVPASLLVIGDGSDRAALEAIASEKVKFAGYREDAAGLLSGADLMVITSEREGFSLALIEALQAGVPVLSTRVPGSMDVLPESCLISESELPDLSNIIRSALDQGDAFRANMASTFERARTEFTVQCSAERTLGLYQKILSASD